MGTLGGGAANSHREEGENTFMRILHLNWTLEN